MSHRNLAPPPARPNVPVLRARVPEWVILAIALMANFMVVIDITIVNVALPSMKAALGLSTNAQQWVVDAYLVTFGGFMLLAARAGDLLGRKRVFLVGLVIFSAASLIGGLAGSGTLLIGARVVQGIGAAVMGTSSLSLLTAFYHEGPARTRALALWSMTGAAASTIGLLLGGVLTSQLSWRYVLFVNVPVGVALIIATALSLSAARPRGANGRLDLPGALTFTVGVSALVYGVSEASIKGWGSIAVLAALAGAAALALAFIAVELRSDAPLVPLGVFRQRGLVAGNLAMACVGAALTSSLFFVTLYLQQIIGYGALRMGVAVVPMTVVLTLGPLVARRLGPRTGMRGLVIVGGLLAAGGLAWWGLDLHTRLDYATQALGPELLLGAGLGLMMLPLSTAATSGISRRQAGLASGLFNMARQLGGAIALAILVTVASTTARHSHLASPVLATLHGYRVALLVCAGIMLAATLVALALPRAKAASRAAAPERAQRAAAPTADARD